MSAPRKNYVGERRGKLVVIAQERRKCTSATGKTQQRSMLTCRCDCGKIAKIHATSNAKSCGCRRRYKTPSPDVGQRFGRLVVTSVQYEKMAGKNSLFLTAHCHCDCGNDYTNRVTYLWSGKVVSCGCYARARKLAPPRQAALNSKFLNYRINARKRGLVWGLTKEQFLSLVLRPCIYCGVVGSNTMVNKHTDEIVNYNGIDRVDNAIGYTEANCVPCCRACNFAKGQRSLAEFMTWTDRLVAFRTLQLKEIA